MAIFPSLAIVRKTLGNPTGSAATFEVNNFCNLVNTLCCFEQLGLRIDLEDLGRRIKLVGDDSNYLLPS